MTFPGTNGDPTRDLTQESAGPPIEVEALRLRPLPVVVRDTSDVPPKRFAVVTHFSSLEEKPSRTATVEDIYPRLMEEASVLRTAIALLGEAEQRADAAVAAIGDDDLVAADIELQHLQAVLPELFCCRSLGDGFGSIVNGIQIAFANQRGLLFNSEQVGAIARAVRRLQHEPFLSIDQAVDIVAALEDVDIIVEPPGLGELADLGNEQSLS